MITVIEASLQDALRSAPIICWFRNPVLSSLPVKAEAARQLTAVRSSRHELKALRRFVAADRRPYRSVPYGIRVGNGAEFRA